jgi:hypothetical protein
MDNPFLFMQIANTFGNLPNTVPSKVFTKVGEMDNLMEEFPAFA